MPVNDQSDQQQILNEDMASIEGQPTFERPDVNSIEEAAIG